MARANCISPETRFRTRTYSRPERKTDRVCAMSAGSMRLVRHLLRKGRLAKEGRRRPHSLPSSTCRQKDDRPPTSPVPRRSFLRLLENLLVSVGPSILGLGDTRLTDLISVYGPYDMMDRCISALIRSSFANPFDSFCHVLSLLFLPLLSLSRARAKCSLYILKRSILPVSRRLFFFFVYFRFFLKWIFRELTRGKEIYCEERVRDLWRRLWDDDYCIFQSFGSSNRIFCNLLETRSTSQIILEISKEIQYPRIIILLFDSGVIKREIEWGLVIL